MSIKIGTSGSERTVTDVIFGTSNTESKNVQKVIDWNQKVIWERASPKIDITGKLSYDTDPANTDFYASGKDEFTYTYNNKYLGISNVRYTGTSPTTPLTLGTDYEVSYSGDTSGTITHSGYTTEHNNATAHINGIGKYTGQVNQAYTITHLNYQSPPPSYTGYVTIYLKDPDQSENYTKLQVGDPTWSPPAMIDTMYIGGSGYLYKAGLSSSTGYWRYTKYVSGSSTINYVECFPKFGLKSIGVKYIWTVDGYSPESETSVKWTDNPIEFDTETTNLNVYLTCTYY